MMLLTEEDKQGLFSWVFTRDKADPVEFIRAVQRRQGQRGSKAMAEYVKMAELGVVSINELHVACLLMQYDITGWIANAQVRLPGQPWRRVDFLFAKEKLVIEADSWQFHSSRQAFDDDRWRDAQLQAAGYRVLRLTWNQVHHQSHATADLIRSMLAG